MTPVEHQHLVEVPWYRLSSAEAKVAREGMAAFAIAVLEGHATALERDIAFYERLLGRLVDPALRRLARRRLTRARADLALAIEELDMLAPHDGAAFLDARGIAA